jgi:hypothetical protein
MKYAFALFGAAAILASFSGASAQTAEPTYKADPDVYKIVYEDEKVRIIESTRKAGVTDKLHGHPLKSIVYGVTECKTAQTADGKTTETDTKPGTARALPVIPAHTAKNIGSEDCKQLFVELK